MCKFCLYCKTKRRVFSESRGKEYLNSALDRWRRLCHSMGLAINDGKHFTLHFADNQVIIAEYEDEICYILTK